MLVSDSQLKTSAHSSHVALAVVLQVRDGVLQALLWERARDPDAGRWALPGGDLLPGETLDDSLRRHLAAKVVVRELSHLEQLGTWSEPDRFPGARQLATARSEEHTSELQSHHDLVCRLLLEKKKKKQNTIYPLTKKNTKKK